MSPPAVATSLLPDRDCRLDELDAHLEKICDRAQAEGGERVERIFRYAAEQLIAHRNPMPMYSLLQCRRIPVTIEEFVEHSDYLGNVANVWPTLMPDLKALNPDVFAGEKPVHEAFLGGATGIGKSTVARITLLYQVYLLTCLRDLHRLFGLDPSTIFVFPLQSVTPDITRRVLYEPLREMFEAMPYVQQELRWNRRRTSALEIEGGIHVVPLVANIESLLGQAIPGAVLDEVNYMRIVEQSKRVAGPRGLGGRYDQANELYREISQRRRSRFLGQPISIGCIIISSSAHYRDDFLDRRIHELDESGEDNIVVTRHKRYDIVPPDRYYGETFRLLVGTERYQTRILIEDEAAPNGGRVEDVPVEHLDEFRRDPEFALRTVVGVAGDSIAPFISEREKIVEAIELGETYELEHWVNKPHVTLDCDGFPRWLGDAIPNDREARRFVHIDLAHTRDACGIAVVKQIGMVDIRNPNAPDTIERKPLFAVEAAISIKPSPDSELIFSELRRWLMELVDCHGLDIYMVSFDRYQSADSMQILRRRGIRTQVLSVDESPGPYEYLRECLLENRIAMVDSTTLRRELIQLERNPETQRVDHPPRGSKDVADAVCGAIAAAAGSRTLRRKGGYFDNEGRRKMTRREGRRREGRRRR